MHVANTSSKRSWVPPATAVVTSDAVPPCVSSLLIWRDGGGARGGKGLDDLSEEAPGPSAAAGADEEEADDDAGIASELIGLARRANIFEFLPDDIITGTNAFRKGGSLSEKYGRRPATTCAYRPQSTTTCAYSMHFNTRTRARTRTNNGTYEYYHKVLQHKYEYSVCMICVLGTSLHTRQLSTQLCSFSIARDDAPQSCGLYIVLPGVPGPCSN